MVDKSSNVMLIAVVWKIYCDVVGKFMTAEQLPGVKSA